MANAKELFPALFGESKPSAADVARANRMPADAMRLMQYTMRQASKRISPPSTGGRRAASFH